MPSRTTQTKVHLRAGTAIALLAAVGFFPAANAIAQEAALPQGGQVNAGTVTIAPSADGSHLAVNQSSRTAILSWQSFSVGGKASAHFDNGAGATLNRVRGNVPSTIDGTLSATGSLFLVNPAGVTVGSGGLVATGGSFVGTTHDVADSDFLDGGAMSFQGASKAGVVNAGTIRSAQGDVALIARRVENTGTIEAPGGTAALAAGYKVLMRDKAGAKGKFSVEIGGSDTEVVNTGTIEAAAAEMRANGGNVYALAGNTDSVVKATGVKKTGGRIFLTAGGGGTVKTTQHIVARREIQPLPQTAPVPTPRPESGGDVRIAGGHVEIGGTVDASGAGGAGGTIVATGDAIALTAGARLDASGTRGGTVLVGGDMRGGADAADKFLSETIATAETLNVAEGAVIAAGGTAGDGGDVVLWSDEQTTYAGHISATGGGTGDGGFAEVSGKKRLAFTGTADLRAAKGAFGTLLLDPYNVTIADAPDSNVSGFAATDIDSVIDVNRLQTQLASANVTVSTGSGGDQAGDITVADPVKWSANKLTLNAAGSIIVDAPMTATGTAGLAFAYNQADAGGGYAINAPVNLDATGSFSTRSGSEGSVINYTIIDRLGAVGSATGTDLQGIQANLAGKYVLGADIDASATSGWNGGAGFVPVGFNSVFTGVFDGLGHVVSGLVINRPSSNYVGLFSDIGLVGVVRNVGLQGGSISGHDYVGGLAGRNAVVSTIRNAYAMSAVEGRDYVGGLVGQNAGGTIINAYATGAVSGRLYVGGLTGNNAGTISNAYATGRVNGSSDVGGLAGWNNSGGTISRAYATGRVNGDSSVVGGLVGFNSQGTISDAYATGRVNGEHKVGGLVGENGTGSISSAYATGAVSGISNIGGLVGLNWDAISNAYTTGTVSGGDYVGGLVGWNNSGSIRSSYATGAASGSDRVGGLVGENSNGGTISSAYATGAVSGTSNVGGLAGLNSGLGVSIQRSYWDTDTTGRSDACGSNSGTCDATGLTTDEALAQNNYSDFDFTNTWFMVDGATRPFLRSEWSTTIRNTHQLQLMTMDLSADYQLAGDIDFGTTFTDDSRADMWATRYDSGTDSYVGAGFAPVGSDGGNAFTGALDGQGHVISELTIARRSEDNVGLFGVTDNATIGNVGLEGGTVSGNYSVGGLVGYQHDGSITQSYNTVTVSGRSAVGGLVGTQDGSILQSYATGDVLGNYAVGGLVGHLPIGGSSIAKSYATGAVSGGGNVGGLVGNQDGGSIEQSYATGAVTGDSFLGGLIGYQWDGLVTSSFWDTDTTGMNDGSGHDEGTFKAVGLTTANARDQSSYTGWDFKDVWYQAGDLRPMLRAFAAEPDAEGNIPVSNIYQLQLMGADLSKKYILAHDIDASATDSTSNSSGIWGAGGFAPVGSSANAFTGTFDGQDHVVSNLVIDRPSSDHIGLFGHVGAPGVVRNVGLTGGTISGRSFVGGLTGSNSGTINSAYATGDVEGSSNYVGSLAGSNSGTINNAYATGDVKGSDYVGGLAGSNSGTISNAYATGDVKGSSDNVGGLGGYNSGGRISHSFFDKDTTNQTSGCGGDTCGDIGLRTAEMQNPFTFIDAGWDFGKVWGKSSLDENGAYMMLRGPGSGTLYDDYVRLAGTDPLSRFYGDGNPALSGIVEEHVGPGTIEVDWDSTSINATTGVGTYAFSDALDVSSTAAGGVYTDYGSGKVTIDKAPLTITANDRAKTYGDALSFTGTEFTISGQKNGETVGTVTLASLGAGEDSDAGSYAITASNATGGSFDIDNYEVTYTNGTLAVAKRALTITPEAVSRIYGNANPLTGMATGDNLVNGDTITSVDLASVANAASDVGAYDLTASNADGTGLSNYAITYATNSVGLTVTPRPITVTEEDKTRLYGEINPPLTYTLGGMGLVNGDTLSGALATAADNTSSVGDYTIAQGSLTASANYDLTFNAGTLTVMPRLLMVAADDVSKIFGAPIPPLSASVTGGSLAPFHATLADALLGFSLTSRATQTSPIGTYAITVSGTNDNYALTLRDGTLTIGDNPAGPFGAIERSFWPNFISGPDKDADAKRGESADAVCMAGVLGPECARMPHPANRDLGPWLKAAAQ